MAEKRQRDEGADEEDSEDVPLSALVPKKSKEEAVKEEPAEEEDSDDVPLMSLVKESKKKKKKKATTAKPRKKAAAKSRRAPVLDEEEGEEEDSGEEFVEEKPKKRKASSKRAPVLDESSSEEDIPLAQLAMRSKKKKKKKPQPPKKKAKKSSSSSSSSGKKTKAKKEEEPVWDWWNDPPLPAGKKWLTLKHNGVYFTPEYEAHGVRMLYDGKKVELTREQEEAATYFARYIKTDHYKKAAFRKNFFADWRVLLGKGHVVKKFELCDFTPIVEHLEAEKEKRKARSKEEKEKEKAEKAKLLEQYGWAEIDGHKQRVGNFTVEPPGIFLGRGKHPKTGMIKKRVAPEDVTLNLSHGAQTPKAPAGHRWGQVVHDDSKTYLAKWTENINGQTKYVFLSTASRTKGMSDRAKFDKARALRKHVKRIRADYNKAFKGKDEALQQQAVCIYLIDVLALRVGGEKDTNEVADTVGCCNLRVEHVKTLPENQVTFDFLGKDSMRYLNTVTVLPAVHKCIKAFSKGKEGSEQLFDTVTPSSLNKFLKTYMKGLSGKVFRTFNASDTLARELAKTPEGLDEHELVQFYNSANRQVAILCNHRRTVSAKLGEMVEKAEIKISELKGDVDDLKDHAKRLKAGKAPKKRPEGKKALPTTVEKTKARITALEERIKREQLKKEDRVDNSEVALNTSKLNYNDPRITYAWSDQWGVPIEKLFSKTVRERFPWAAAAKEGWEF